MSRQGRPSTKRATKSAPVIDNPPIDETVDEITNETDRSIYETEGETHKASAIITQINIIDEIITALKTMEKTPTNKKHILIGFFDDYNSYNKIYKNEERGDSYSVPFYIISVGIIKGFNSKKDKTEYFKIGSLLENNENYDKIKYLSTRQFIKVDSDLYNAIINQKEKRIYKFYVNKFIENKDKKYGEYSINLNYCDYDMLKNNTIINTFDKSLPIYKNMLYAYETHDIKEEFITDINTIIGDLKLDD